MAGDLEITGTEQFVALARRLNAQGSGGRGLWRELNSTMKAAAQPMTDVMLRHLSDYLPDRYAGVLRTAMTVRVSRSTKGAAAGLKLVGTAKGVKRKRHIRVINDGTLRHEVYGNPEVWVDQKVRPGFWTTPLSTTREIPATQIRRAIQNTIRKID
jgi:ribosomal protein L36